eukprot:scaffold144304_cov178-Phaeocystis_antarctica.AAC.1
MRLKAKSAVWLTVARKPQNLRKLINPSRASYQFNLARRRVTNDSVCGTPIDAEDAPVSQPEPSPARPWAPPPRALNASSRHPTLSAGQRPLLD